MLKLKSALLASLLAPFLLSATALAHSPRVPKACLDVALRTGGGAGGGNGGLIEESLFREHLLKVDRFLRSDLGKKVYPDIDADDFSIVANQAQIFLREVKGEDDQIRDHFGNVRSCAWSRAKCLVECNVEAYRSILKGKIYTLEGLKDGPSAPFELGAHEVFGMLGYETGTKEAPSDTHLSGRLGEHIQLVMSYDFLDSRKTQLATMAESGFVCSDRFLHTNGDDLKSVHVLLVTPDWKASFHRLRNPSVIFRYGESTYDSNGKVLNTDWQDAVDFTQDSTWLASSGEFPKAAKMGALYANPDYAFALTPHKKTGENYVVEFDPSLFVRVSPSELSRMTVSARVTRQRPTKSKTSMDGFNKKEILQLHCRVGKILNVFSPKDSEL